MPNALCQVQSPRYRCLFPDWSGPRPLRFFMMEHLLEARRTSAFPTNAAGYDEDVNVYLAHLLTTALTCDQDPRLIRGAAPVLYPSDKNISPATRAEAYRLNADTRMLHLGLFNRGDGLRRRAVLWGYTPQQMRRLDLGVGASCYNLAADLLQDRPGQSRGLVDVYRKLARNFDDYVHVLGVLATRRLGLGANLSDHDLSSLIDQSTEMPAQTTDKQPNTVRQTGPRMDAFLDLLSQYKKQPDSQVRTELIQMAQQLGLDCQTVLPDVNASRT